MRKMFFSYITVTGFGRIKIFPNTANKVAEFYIEQ